MFYDFSFTIPANTTKKSPLREDINLTHGIIHRVEIGFPAGCAGLVYLQIVQGLHQIWPTNADGSFNTDDYTIAFNEYEDMTTEPFTLTLIGWNLDDTYDHTLEIRIGILPMIVLKPEETFLQAFKALLRRLRL